MRVFVAVLSLACALSVGGVAHAEVKKGSATRAAAPHTSDGMACDNRIYAKVLAANASDTAFLEKFKAAQRSWIVFRDAQIAARYPSPADYGSVLPMCESGEYEQLTRDRIKQLNAWVAGTEEGDVCAGSYPMSGQ